jgi:hypothetical protein
MEMGKPPTRRLSVFLRDFRMVEATIRLAEGQTLASYFANRKSYVNLSGAHWTGAGDTVEHVVLRLDQVLWAAARDGDVPLTTASLAVPTRCVEFQLDGGLLFRGRLALSEQQRLSDYLESAGQFMPVLNAQLLRSGRPPREVNVQLGDVVLNQQAIHAAWEAADRQGSGEKGSGRERLEAVPGTAGAGNDED